MSAPTVAVEWLLARAAVRSTGLLHVVSRRDTGALNPVCGANPIRSAQIEERHSLDDVSLLCAACGALAADQAGSVEEGVAVYLSRGTAAAGRPVLLELATDRIRVDAGYVRRSPGEDLDGLVASVRERGVVQPLAVRRTPAGYELVAGARRLYAARVAGLTTVPAIVRDLDDADAALDALLSNLHRADQNPIEQATGFSRALQILGCSKAVLADRLGISRPQVSNTIRLLDLPADLREQLAAGRLTAQQGRELLRVDDAAEQAALAERMLATRTPAGRPAADPGLAAVAELLTGMLDARVRISASAGDRTRIVIDVADADRARILEQLGLHATAA